LAGSSCKTRSGCGTKSCFRAAPKKRYKARTNRQKKESYLDLLVHLGLCHEIATRLVDREQTKQFEPRRQSLFWLAHDHEELGVVIDNTGLVKLFSMVSTLSTLGCSLPGRSSRRPTLQSNDVHDRGGRALSGHTCGGRA